MQSLDMDTKNSGNSKNNNLFLNRHFWTFDLNIEPIVVDKFYTGPLALYLFCFSRIVQHY